MRYEEERVKLRVQHLLRRAQFQVSEIADQGNSDVSAHKQWLNVFVSNAQKPFLLYSLSTSTITVIIISAAEL
jgi:hypothetical protein